jgi:hypothetical protein
VASEKRINHGVDIVSLVSARYLLASFTPHCCAARVPVEIPLAAILLDVQKPPAVFFQAYSLLRFNLPTSRGCEELAMIRWVLRRWRFRRKLDDGAVSGLDASTQCHFGASECFSRQIARICRIRFVIDNGRDCGP